MKVAVIGSRSIKIKNLWAYLPYDTDEIISGANSLTDAGAADYAIKHGIKLTVFTPDYDTYGKSAVLKRTAEMIDYCDEVLIFDDGVSRHIKYIIKKCKSKKRPVKIVKFR